MLVDFTPGIEVDGAISIRLMKFLIYKFFKSNIIWEKHYKNGVLVSRRNFSFHRPFPLDSDGFISKDNLNSILIDDDYFISRHYEYAGKRSPVFCVSKEELLFVVNNLYKYRNYEYSYIFNKKYAWCIYIGESEDETMRIFYPLEPA